MLEPSLGGEGTFLYLESGELNPDHIFCFFRSRRDRRFPIGRSCSMSGCLLLVQACQGISVLSITPLALEDDWYYFVLTLSLALRNEHTIVKSECEDMTLGVHRILSRSSIEMTVPLYLMYY